MPRQSSDVTEENSAGTIKDSMTSLPLPIAAFFAGLISFLSPCVLPLVPGYVSLISGAGVDELKLSQGRLMRRVRPRRQGRRCLEHRWREHRRQRLPLGPGHSVPARSRTKKGGTRRMSLYCATGVVETPRTAPDFPPANRATAAKTKQTGARRRARSKPCAFPRRRSATLVRGSISATGFKRFYLLSAHIRVDGEEVFFIPNPGLGLWAYRGKL